MASSWDIECIKRAWNIATLAHDGQKYGGPTKGQQVEYLNHIGSVFIEVMQALQHHPEANAELALCCAILHDTVEDTPLTVADIETQFGGAIALGVSALSKDETLGTKEAQMSNSLSRIKAQPQEIWIVKMADRISNLSQPPHYWTMAKMKSYQKEGQLIYDHLHTASSFLSNRLKSKIDAYSFFYQ